MAAPSPSSSSSTPTLAYSTHAPGQPIFSSRPNGLPGIEIDIPPQSQRWRASWPPRSAGAWLAIVFAAAGVLAPPVGIGWWALRTHDRQAVPLLMLAGFIECFLAGGIAWFLYESGRRRTTVLAGPDGLTVTTLGGMAWPRPRHWSRAEIKGFAINLPGGDAQERVLVLFSDERRPPESLDGTMLLPKRDVEMILARLREAMEMPAAEGESAPRS
jgi:hypothetical protein